MEYRDCECCGAKDSAEYREWCGCWYCDGCDENTMDATRASYAWEDENGCDYFD